MDRRKNIKFYKRGLSTIELMIAMAIMALVLTAVIMTSFGAQSFLTGSQTNNEAIKIAQGLVEQQQAYARRDFNLVNPYPIPESPADLPDSAGCPQKSVTEDIYSKKICVLTDPENKRDYLTKLVTVIVSWTDERKQEQTIKLNTLVTNFNNAKGGDTCDSSPSGDWTEPSSSIIKKTIILGSPITGVDAYQKKLYVTTNTSTNGATFFIYDITNPSNPSLLSQIDNDTVHIAGLNAVAVDGEYAFVANASGVSVGQFQMINLSSLTITSLKIAGSTGFGSSIFYKDGYVYLGLDTGEFDVIDVHNPSAVIPTVIPGGTYTLSNSINSIFVKGNYAYVATPNNNNITVLDISNITSTHPVSYVGKFSPDDLPESDGVGSNHGKSVAVVDTKLYLGRTYGTNEFFAIDANAVSSPTEFSPQSHFDIGSGNKTSVNDLIIRSHLAFLLTNDKLNILNISNPQNITNWATPIDLGGSAGGSSMDCEGNYIYAGINSTGKLYVISP